MRGRLRKPGGSGIIETAAGLIFMIPVLFILIDVGCLVMVQTSNDAIAKQCARGAGNQQSGNDYTTAGSNCSQAEYTAANDAWNNYGSTGLMTKNNFTCVDNGDGTVTVRTWVTCNLPIPVPLGGPSKQQFEAFSTEPVVGQLP